MPATVLDTAALDHLDEHIRIPRYDRNAVTPGIVHFGVGGFHRAHQAAVVDDLLAAGETSWGICGVGLLPTDAAMRDALRAQDHLYSLMKREADGSETVRVIGAIVDYIFAPEEPERVLARLTDPATRIVSLTITEGGYLQNHATGLFDPNSPTVRADLADPEHPRGAFGYIVEALRIRRSHGIPPFTVMSCDNIRSNGEISRQATVGLARLRSAELADWINSNVMFPNSMVDRITPATTADDRTLICDRHGLRDAWPVASEDFFQWVLEDHFSDGRPPFEKAGVELVHDVVPFELMKLRMLNASHQVLAYLGLLMGHRLVHEAAGDELLLRLLRQFWRSEAIPTLQQIPGVDFSDYGESLLKRYANPYVRDTLERLATDASNRIPTFVLPIVQDRLAAGARAPISTLTVAAWERFVLGVDDEGAPIAAPDERGDSLRQRAAIGGDGTDGFLGEPGVFGTLATASVFASEFAHFESTLRKAGARAAITRALDSGAE
ncbi:mannitol dehydrogenase family protein [Microbacterium caowuchunii]|uniref:Mannitol-1-phosphate 5-dehydrogenase n=1 Tax=Microbacterium caowuchunii TaxID=2614638 RepID=A0A5N0TH69_9MICO|nr:mannitol dehydrogenase family protein [Microbacterium caowuchunii]KAA9134402.1 mannitol dehydrogenase family protein [Microbacterium caowuchunii]